MHFQQNEHINATIHVRFHPCMLTHVAGHHDGEQRLVVRVEGDVEGGRLDHDEDGMED